MKNSMPSWLNKYLSLIAGLLLDTLLFSATARAESHVLLSRSGTYPMVVALDQQQRSWLQGKRELRVGSSAPDYPPFDLTASARDYEGLTADYLGILASALTSPSKSSDSTPDSQPSRHLKKAASTCLVLQTALKPTTLNCCCPLPMQLTSRSW